MFRPSLAERAALAKINIPCAIVFQVPKYEPPNGVSQNWGHRLGCPYHKDYSIRASPCFGKLLNII